MNKKSIQDLAAKFKREAEMDVLFGLLSDTDARCNYEQLVAQLQLPQTAEPPHEVPVELTCVAADDATSRSNGNLPLPC